MAATKTGPIGHKDDNWLAYIVNNIVGCISAKFGHRKWRSEKVGTSIIRGKLADDLHVSQTHWP